MGRKGSYLGLTLQRGKEHVIMLGNVFIHSTNMYHKKRTKQQQATSMTAL